MPFSRPTLSSLRALVAADVTASLPGADGLLRFSNLAVLGKAVAGLAHLHYGYLDWISLQSVPYTATGEYLEGWAGLKGVTRKPAVAATGQASFTGTVGATIPQGTQVVRGDGTAYVTTASATVAANGQVAAPIAAVAPAAAGTLVQGSAVSLGAVIAGIQSTGTVTAISTPGADVETDDSLRSRMLQVYAAPPQGGAPGDYLTWALAVPGVTRAWVAPNGMGAGTVVVYVMLDQAEAAFGGFPQGANGVAAAEPRAVPATGDQLAVANAIYSTRPVTALVYVAAPTANPVNFTITGIAGASAATKAAISAAISSVFLQYGDPRGVAVDLSYIEAAISAIAGTAGFVVTAPAGNIANAVGQLPTLGVVTYL